ncbi:MAG: 6-bladed beta-propeller [Bacteroidota bacterium]|nr:6-bladed beta-propeller [Bacteroidota bacterium]
MRNTLFICLIILSIGCSDKNSINTNQIFAIEIDESNINQELDISNIFDSLRVTPLDYKTGFIGKIEGIEFFNNNYFIHDSSVDQILIFDLEGNYQNKIYAQGPGPEEYGTINFFDIDKSNNQIVIFDISMGALSYFDFTGKFLEKKHLKAICRDFSITKSGNIICYSPDEIFENNDKIYQPGIFLISKNGKIIDYQELGNTGFIPMLTGKSLIEYDEKNYLFSNYNDIIYEITDSEIETFVELKFKNNVKDEVFYNPDYNTENMMAPFLKVNPYKRQGHIGYTFLQKNEIRFIDINLQSKDYQIGKKLKKNNDFKFFNLNGVQVSDNEFITILNDEILLQYKAYLKSSDELEQEFKELESLLLSNNKNPILISGFFKK